jgi:hypothetical protein
MYNGRNDHAQISTVYQCSQMPLPIAPPYPLFQILLISHWSTENSSPGSKPSKMKVTHDEHNPFRIA